MITLTITTLFLLFIIIIKDLYDYGLYIGFCLLLFTLPNNPIKALVLFILGIMLSYFRKELDAYGPVLLLGLYILGFVW